LDGKHRAVFQKLGVRVTADKKAVDELGNIENKGVGVEFVEEDFIVKTVYLVKFDRTFDDVIDRIFGVLLIKEHVTGFMVTHTAKGGDFLNIVTLQRIKQWQGSNECQRIVCHRYALRFIC